MADLVFNAAMGRAVQWCQNVEDSSPAAARIQINAWVAGGATEADLRDAVTITALEATSGVTEATPYTPIVMDETELTITINNTTNLVDVDSIDVTFTAVAAQTAWSDLSISYDDDGTDTDSNTIPMTWHDFVVTPNGGDITINFAAAGFFRAS